MAEGREVHRTDRMGVAYDEEADAYVIELPTDFEEAYTVNAAHIHFYRPESDSPVDSFEMRFSEKRVAELDGLTLPDDSYAGCEFEVVFLYEPSFGMPYEIVGEEVAELQLVEELERRVTSVSTLAIGDERHDVDYICIDVRDPETEDYVTGKVVSTDELPAQANEETTLASGAVTLFPSEFAGFEAEITYLAAGDL